MRTLGGESGDDGSHAKALWWEELIGGMSKESKLARPCFSLTSLPSWSENRTGSPAPPSGASGQESAREAELGQEECQ